MELTETARENVGTKHEECHVYCPCDINRALCGTDVADHRFDEKDAVSCVVCDDLMYEPCERCGY